MSSEPREVDRWACHQLPDHSGRDSGKTASLLVGGRGGHTELSAARHSQPCKGRTFPVLPSTHACPRGSPAGWRAAPPLLFPNSCCRCSILSFLELLRQNLPTFRARRGGGSGHKDSKGKQGCGTCPWGQGQSLEPHPHWDESPGCFAVLCKLR